MILNILLVGIPPLQVFLTSELAHAALFQALAGIRVLRSIYN